MGSQCYLKFKSINPERFSLCIRKDDEIIHDYNCTMNSEFEISFHFPGEYTVSFLPPVMDGEILELWDPRIGYLTVTNVSDFCWMILNFVSYFRESIQVIESRPDPFFMLKHALDRV